MGGVLAGLIFGNANANQRDLTTQIGHFPATRPMTSPEMFHHAPGLRRQRDRCLGNLGRGVPVVVRGPRLDTCRSQIKLPSEVGWWYFPLTLLGGWIGLTFLATIGQTGRPKLFGIVFFGIPVLTIGNIMISQLALTPEAQTRCNDSIATVVGMLFLIGTFWAFTAARRRAMIGTSTTWASIGLWLTLSAVVVLLWWQYQNEHAPISLFRSRGVSRPDDRFIGLSRISNGHASAGIGVESESVRFVSREVGVRGVRKQLNSGALRKATDQ